MIYDIDRKKMSIERNKAEADYFSARPKIDFDHMRDVFCAGFEIAWDAKQEEIDRLND